MNAEEVEARGMAKAILDKAQADAAQIIAKAHQEEQAILEEARRKGKEEGLAHVTEELARAKMQAGEMLKAASKDVVALALIVAEKIIGRDLERDPNTMIEICAAAIENVRNAKQMVLRVNPEDGAILRNGAKALMQLVGRSVDIAIKDDSDVRKGGCVVQTEFGTIDAQLSTQLGMLKEILISDDAKKSGPA